MKKQSQKIWTALFLFSFSLLSYGCGQQGLSDKSFSSAGLTSTSNLALPTNLKPAPTLEITAPARAQFLTKKITKVDVVGKVSDTKNTVTSLRVSGQNMAIPGDGNFTTPTTLEDGLNILWAMSGNSAGGTSFSSVAVMKGDYQKDTVLIKDAMLAQLGATGLEKLVAAIQPTLQTLDLQTPMITAPNNLIYASTPLDVTVRAVRYQGMSLGITLGNGQLTIGITINKLEVDSWVNLIFPLPDQYGYLKTDLHLSITANLSVVGGIIKVSIPPASPVGVTFTNYTFTMPVSWVNWVAQTFQDTIRGMIANGIRDKIVTDIPPLISDAFNELQKPIVTKVLGKDMNLTFSPQTVTITPKYVYVKMDSNVKPAIPSGVTLSAPGSLVTQGAAPSLALKNSDFVVSLNDDYLNRVFFAVWRAGFLNVTIDKQFLIDQGVQDPIALDGALLMKFYPELKAHMKETDPVSIQIDAKMPPIMKMKGSPDLVEFSMGELDVAFVVHQGALARKVLTTRIHFKVTISVSVVAGKLKFKLIGKPTIMGDVITEHLMDVDENKIELLLNVIVPTIIPQMTSSVDGMSLPSFPSYKLALDQMSLQQDGASGDFLTIFGSLKTTP